MNSKGFTLIELIAILLILGVIVGISVYSISSLFKSTKDKTEDVFVETITDALDMYLASDAKKVTRWFPCDNKIDKPTLGSRSVEYASVYFSDVIDTGALEQGDLINPANEKLCMDASLIPVNIYRDVDRVYYYEIQKNDFDCLIKNDGFISNLPEGFICK